MRKASLVLLILSLSLSVLLSDSLMRLYDDDSYEYRETKRLSQIAGVIGPSTALPVVGEDLRLALDRIDPALLNKRDREIYSSLSERIGGKNNFEFSLEFDFGPEVYLSKNAYSEFPDSFFLPYEELDPFIKLDMGFSFSDYAFLEFGAELRNDYVAVDKNNKPISYIPITNFDFALMWYDGAFHSPFSAWYPLTPNTEFPNIARGAVGFKWFNVTLGRTRAKIGPGITGQMVMGDNFRYQEMMRLAFTSNYFEYSLSITHFDRETGMTTLNKPSFDDFQDIRVLHRIEANILNKARIGLDLGFLLYVRNALDIRLFTPLMIVHDWYNFNESKVLGKESDESNNIMGLDVEYAFLPRWNIAMELVVDQFALPWERDMVPNAIGALLNLSYIGSYRAFDIKYYGEIVYTSPNLYLNHKENPLNTDIYGPPGELNGNLDWAVGYWSKYYSPLRWAGYRLGPDTLGGKAGGDFYFYDIDLEYALSLSYFVSGETYIGSLYHEDNVSTPTGRALHSIELYNGIKWKYKGFLEIRGDLNMNFSVYDGRFDFNPEALFGVKLKFGGTW